MFSCLNDAPPAAAKTRVVQPPRHREALRTKESQLKEHFSRQGVTYPPRKIYLRIFKKEALLELWAQGSGADSRYILVKSYAICAASGGLGPKRRVGDLQVPEGFYRVTHLNPYSAYYLSMGINYPNDSDRVRSHHRHLGGAIMIHGDCASIGCVAITDEQIKEVYIAAAKAFASGQVRIPVHIYPTRLDETGWRFLVKQYATQTKLLSFWQELKPGYEYFEHHQRLFRIIIRRDGRYVVRPPRRP